MKAKILIVGGGTMGLNLALHAAQRTDPLTDPVVVLEKGRMGEGSSGRAVAILHAAYSDRAMASMARDALKLYSTLSSNTGRSVGFRRTGALVLVDSSDEQALAQLDQDIAMQKALGINVERVEADDIRSFFPGIEVEDDAVGAFQTDGGFMDAGRAIQTLATLARQAGAVTRVGVGQTELLLEDGRVVGVRTEDGEYRSENVVLATGVWTQSILSELGVDLPLTGVRTREVHFRMPPVDVIEDDDAFGEGAQETRFMPDPLETLPVAHPVLVDRSKGIHVRCEPVHGRTRVGRFEIDGADVVQDPAHLDADADPQFEAWAGQTLRERLPVYQDMEQVGHQTSHTCITPDRRPVVGPVPGLPGLWVVTGFSGLDFQLSPNIGEGLAQMILGEPVSAFTPAPFSTERFA